MSDDEFVPWSERADDDNVDDFIAMMADAVNHQVSSDGSDLVGNIVADAVQSRGENVGILGNFLLISEVINDDGEANLMVVTSDKLPEWIARGMLMVADEHITHGPPFLPEGGFE